MMESKSGVDIQKMQLTQRGIAIAIVVKPPVIFFKTYQDLKKAHWLALSPDSKKVQGSNALWTRVFSVFCLQVFPCLRGFSPDTLLPTCFYGGWIGCPSLNFGLMVACLCELAQQWAGDSKVYRTSGQKTARIDSLRLKKGVRLWAKMAQVFIYCNFAMVCVCVCITRLHSLIERILLCPKLCPASVTCTTLLL